MALGVKDVALGGTSTLTPWLTGTDLTEAELEHPANKEHASASTMPTADARRTRRTLRGVPVRGQPDRSCPALANNASSGHLTQQPCDHLVMRR